MRSREEKLTVVKRNLSGESARSLAVEIGCSDRQALHQRTMQHLRRFPQRLLQMAETGWTVEQI